MLQHAGTKIEIGRAKGKKVYTMNLRYWTNEEKQKVVQICKEERQRAKNVILSRQAYGSLKDQCI